MLRAVLDACIFDVKSFLLHLTLLSLLLETLDAMPNAICSEKEDAGHCSFVCIAVLLCVDRDIDLMIILGSNSTKVRPMW